MLLLWKSSALLSSATRLIAVADVILKRCSNTISSQSPLWQSYNKSGSTIRLIMYLNYVLRVIRQGHSMSCGQVCVPEAHVALLSCMHGGRMSPYTRKELTLQPQVNKVLP